jgi:ketosteroid isomerase-like protein
MLYGLSAEEIEWLRDGYRMFREADPAFVDRFATDAKMIIPKTVPGGGTFDSPLEWLESTATIGELFDDPHPDPEEFLRVGDRVIVIGTWRARSHQSGEKVTARFVHLLRLSDADAPVSDQQAVSFENVADTAAVLQALGPAPPASK